MDVEQLPVGIQQRMGEMELSLAEKAGLRGSGRDAPDRLVIVDGRLRGRQHLTGAIGYIRTHQVGYLPDALTSVVTSLAPGQRTPLFMTQTTCSRYSSYLRLPCEQGAWETPHSCTATCVQAPPGGQTPTPRRKSHRRH
jgi:hypothetical protein